MSTAFDSIKFDLIERGAIRISVARFLSIYHNHFVLEVDCMEKRPEYDVQMSGDDEITIMLSVGEETLRVANDAPRGDDGDYISTTLVISGLEKGDWYAGDDYRKYGFIFVGSKLPEDPAEYPAFSMIDFEEE